MTNSCLHRTALLLATALLLTACAGGGGVPTRFYIIGPLESEPLASSNSPPAVEILALDLPQYLERVQIATQVGPNQLRFSEGNQWSENLRKNLLRTLTRNLSRLLGSPSIGAPGARSAANADYRVRVNIEQFERDTAGLVRLDASWQIIDASGATPVRSYQSHLSSTQSVAAGDYDAIVATMQELFGDLSLAIARELLAPVDPGS